MTGSECVDGYQDIDLSCVLSWGRPPQTLPRDAPCLPGLLLQLLPFLRYTSTFAAGSPTGPTEHHSVLQNTTRSYRTPSSPTEHHLVLENTTWSYRTPPGPKEHHSVLYRTPPSPTEHHLVLQNTTQSYRTPLSPTEPHTI